MAKKKIEKAHQFAAQLAELLGDNLVSLLLYGSYARAGYAQEPKNVNLLLIVRDGSAAALRPIEPAVREWVHHREPPPMIVTHSEWHASTDVFPIEIEDMRDTHTVLAGVDPFHGVTTDPGHLRHQLERELRGKLTRLRSEYAAVAPDARELTQLLLNSVPTFFVLMRALVRLTGGEPGANPSAVVEQAVQAANLDASAFDWVVAKVAGESVRPLKAYDPVGARYVDEIEKMTEFVDRYVMKNEALPSGDSSGPS